MDAKHYPKRIIRTHFGLSYHTPIPWSNRRLLDNRTHSITTDLSANKLAAWLGLVNVPQDSGPLNRSEQSFSRSTKVPGASSISLRNFDLYESASCDIDTAIQELIAECQSSASTRSFIEFFRHPALLSKTRTHDGRCIIWADYEIVTLPVLYFKTLCLVAVGSYNEREVLIDDLLERHSTCIKDKSTQYFRRVVPMIVLLSKIFLTQGTFYMLEKLVSSTLLDFSNIQGLENESWQLHQLLYAAMIFEPYPKEVTMVHFSVYRVEKQVLIDLLTSAAANNTPSNLRHNIFILGALELLRLHCSHLHCAADSALSATPDQEQAVLDTTFAHAIEDTDVHMVLVAANGLVESFKALRNDGQAQYWETRLNQLRPADEWKHSLLAAAAPIYKTLERYIEHEWPFVPLIRSGASEVFPAYETSAPLI